MLHIAYCDGMHELKNGMLTGNSFNIIMMFVQLTNHHES